MVNEYHDFCVNLNATHDIHKSLFITTK